MEEPDFVREVSKGGMLCPLPRSKPEKFDLNFVKWDFEQLHRKYVEVEDVTRAEGLSREQLVLSMRFFSFYKHHDIKIFTPSSHTIIFIVHEWVNQCLNVQGKRKVKNRELSQIVFRKRQKYVQQQMKDSNPFI